MKSFLCTIYLCIIFLFNVCWILLSSDVQARPVSYAGGITFMQLNDLERQSLHLHYSPTVNYSIGYKGEYWREDKWQFHGIQLNNLIKRWNRRASQANAYLKSGVGFVRTRAGDNSLAAFTGIAADWETRRFFTLYENRYYDAGDADRFFSQKARLGIAPYIGDYGDLHTWLMIQIDHSPENDDPIVVTPLVRLFKHEYLVEMGVNDQGKLLFNLIARF